MGKRKLYTLLLLVRSGTVTVEISVSIKPKLPSGPAEPLLGIYPGF